MSPVVFAAVSVGAGTAAGLGRPYLAWPLTALACVATAVAGVLRRDNGRAVVAAVIALGAAAGGSASWRGSVEALGPDLAGARAMVRACGSVRAVKPRSVEIRADSIKWRSRTWHVSEPLRVSGRGAARLPPGSGLCASGELVPPRPDRDEAPLLKADEISRRGTGSTLRLLASSVRSRFARAALGALPRRHAGLLLGMTDGDVSLIDDATTRDFRTTGLAHLVAVSGYNVAVFLALVMLLLRAVVPRGRWLRVVLAVPALILFAVLTGLEPSVLRAPVSAGVALTVVAGGRRTEALRNVAFAFVVLVLASPEMLFDPGFQLSFGATLGIVAGGEPISARFARLLPDSRFGHGVAAGLGTTIAAQVSVAPLLAWHFGRIPGIGGLANLVAIPLGGFVMVGGMGTLTAASLTDALDWAPAMMRLPLDVILAAAHGFARFPAASVALSTTAAVALTGLLVVLFARSMRVRAGAAALVVLCAGLVGGRSFAGGGCGAPAVDALDVGQGSAVLLRTPGHAALVDAGPADGGVVRQLKALGIGRLDAMVITHSHIDHALGALSVLRELEVGSLLGPPQLRWAAGAQVIRAARTEGVEFRELVAGDAFEAGPALHLDVLWPEEESLPFDEDLVDRYSLVVRARLAGVDVLLPGDIRAEQQAELAEEDVAAPIMVAVHHGSKNLDEEFVEAVDPAVTLITVGAPNPYGLPAPEAVRAYARHGRVFRTDKDGRVSVCVAGGRAEVIQER